MASKSLPEDQVDLDRTPSSRDEATETFETPDERRKNAETQGIRELNSDLRYNRLLRSKYAKWVFCYLVSYSAFVAAILIAVGFEIRGFKLPASVVEFLVGSTAASAIGLVFAVTNGLFKTK